MKKLISYSIPNPATKRRLRIPTRTQHEYHTRHHHSTQPLLLHAAPEEQHPLSHPAHCLGVNSLAIDSTTRLLHQQAPGGILYTAGKDGLVAAWELGLSQERQPPSTQFRQCIQSHTNWCNDILLCNYSQTLISASSDRTVKAWSPHDPSLSLCPITIGTHNDYVKCLAHSPASAWVASAGLDRKILLWDIHETRPKPLLRFPDNPSSPSIYSLATTPTGQILATGSPAQPIGLYDPRLCSQVAKLVGHTGNVRSILLSDDGSRLLSASSDTTVKMWDVRMQRCLHTFSHHSTSVWALHSQHPSLQVFHSGDRSGWLCKVDLEGSDDFGEGECVVLCHTGRREEHNAANEGIVKIVALDDTFVWTATGSSSVQRWRDIPSRLQRRRDAPTADQDLDLPPNDNPKHVPSAHSSATPCPLRSPQAVSFNLKPSSSPIPPLLPSLVRESNKSPPASIIQPAANTNSSCPPQFIYIPPNKLDDVPLESLVPLFSPFDNLLHNSDRPDPESITIHSLKSFSSDLSPHRSPNDTRSNLTHHASISPSNLRFQDFEKALPTTIAETQLTPTVRNPLPRPTISRTAAWRLYTTRDSAAEAVPLRDAPDDIIPGCPGLVKSELLNDRRHVITLDTRGRLALWDIIGCTCVGIFDTDDLELEDDGASSMGSVGSPSSFPPNELLKLVKERIEGEATIGTWCMVETQTGLLTVHLDENRCFDAEVYADESGLSPETLSSMKEDHRLCLGKWILRNLFDGFITRQAQLRSQNDETPTARPTTGPTDHQTRVGSEDQESNHDHTELPHQQSNHSAAKTFVPRLPGMSIALATPALTPALPPEIKHTQASNGTAKNPQGSSDHSADYFSLPRVVEADEDKLAPETAFMNGAPDYSSTDASSSYSSSINPPSSPRRASPDPISIDGHPRTTEDKVSTSESPTPNSSSSQQNSASIFTRFRSLGRGQKRRGSQDPPVPAVISNPIPFRDFAHDSTKAELNEQQEALMEQRKVQQQMVQTILSRPFEPIGEVEAPKIASLPEETTILISEEQAETGAWEVSYRGLVVTTYEDADLLLQLSPLWLLDFLLGNRLPSSTHNPSPSGLVKVTFVLQPEGGPEAAGLPVLANGNARLTASRALRMKKVASYVIQKLDSSSSSSKSPQQEKSSTSSSGSKSKSTGTCSPTTTTTTGVNHPSNDSSSRENTSSSSPILNISTPISNHGHGRKIGDQLDESQIVLTCHGIVVPHHVSLGVVKQFFGSYSSLNLHHQKNQGQNQKNLDLDNKNQNENKKNSTATSNGQIGGLNNNRDVVISYRRSDL